MKQYILSFDIGTTGTRAVLYDRDCRMLSSAYRELAQYHPADGWVEQDASEIYDKTMDMAAAAIKKAHVLPGQIAAIGIANQRETTVIWERTTGRPVCNAIVWQDRRTLPICQQLEAYDGKAITGRTGMIIIPNAAATKIAWLRENNALIKQGTDNGSLLYGTLDSYMVFRLTGGRVHVTDRSNNSVTLLQNAASLDYDDDLLHILDIPRHILPALVASSAVIAYTDPERFFGAKVPISGLLGDQQAAAIGQGCLKMGMAKNTYGTGSFMVMNTGENYIPPSDGLFSPVIYSRNGLVNYGLEGMADVSSAVLQWLRDGAGMLQGAEEAEHLARQVPDAGGVYFVPAFSGLGAPYFDPYARGTILGLSQGTTKHHIARAALEAMAYQVCDAFALFEKRSGIRLQRLRVDGGGAKSDLLLQTQADLLGVPVDRPENTEATSLGAAFMAGLAVSYWDSIEQIHDLWRIDRSFEPTISKEHREELLASWKKAVSRASGWLK